MSGCGSRTGTHQPVSTMWLSSSATLPEKLGSFSSDLPLRRRGSDLAHKIEQFVDTLGPQLEDQPQEEITARFEEGRPLAVDDEITDTMVVCIGGGKAPNKGNERIDDDKRRRYDRKFRNVKVASVSALEGDEVDQEALCSNSSYVLGIEHANEFFQRIWVEMKRRSHDLSTLRLVFVGDGAHWIWRRVGDLDNELSRHILDFCHAADHLADVCKALDGEGSDRFHARFKRWRARPREGGLPT